MIIFLHGEDTFLVTRRKHALISAFCKKYKEAEVFTFDLETAGTDEDVKQALFTSETGLFATKKMLVFVNPFLLTAKGDAVMKEFLRKEQTFESETILLFVHGGKIKKSDPLTKMLLSAMDKEEVVDPMQGNTLRRFIEQELREENENVSFAPDAVSLFLTRLDGESARQISELAKLATFKGAGIITKEEVALFIPPKDEERVWQAIDALGRDDRALALALFRSESVKNGSVYPLLALSAWQIRRLLCIREAYDSGVRLSSDIARQTKLPPFTVDKALRTLSVFPLSRLKKGLSLLSDIDTALKQGKADPEVSLDLFVWKF